MDGFFGATVTSGPPIPTVSRCGACGNRKRCNSPGMKPTGHGERGILFVGEAPGETEDEEGVQFVGPAGQHLRELLRELRASLDRDCWKTNAVCCFPGSRNPAPEEVESCRPNLVRTVGELNPSVIILTGNVPLASMMGWIWKRDKDPGPISKWVGYQIPSRQLNAWVCPVFHPSFLRRRRMDVALRTITKRHLQAAFSLKGRPWKKAPPNYESKVEVIRDAGKAARILRRMEEKGGTVAFDYETDRLKPDHPDASIFSCGVCWEGRKTIAYPWAGEAISATSKLLKSGRVDKVGWNLKFEQRWTRAVLGHGVRRAVWDGILGAHVEDNRTRTKSLKFQAFVQLGLPPYDESVGPYLRAASGNERNRIHEANLEDVLLYNGMDALLTYILVKKQRGRIK